MHDHCSTNNEFHSVSSPAPRKKHLGPGSSLTYLHNRDHLDWPSSCYQRISMASVTSGWPTGSFHHFISRVTVAAKLVRERVFESRPSIESLRLCKGRRSYENSPTTYVRRRRQPHEVFASRHVDGKYIFHRQIHRLYLLGCAHLRKVKTCRSALLRNASMTRDLFHSLV